MNRLVDMPAVQRRVVSEQYAQMPADDLARVKKFFADYDEATTRAYNYILSVPSLQPYANRDGRTQLWVKTWNNYLAGEHRGMMAADFGYAVESLACDPLVFQPAAPEGCTVLPQQSYGSTRPDLVLQSRASGKDLAWLDLTASGNEGHIHLKDAWARRIGTFAEATYPSLTGGNLNFMYQNRHNTGAMSAEQFAERKAAADAEHEQCKAHWISMGDCYRYSQWRAAHRRKYGPRALDPQVEKHKREFITDRLKNDFTIDIEEHMMSSILMAMLVPPTSWGFGTGYSGSERAGEAWLRDHAKQWTKPPEQPTSGSLRVPRAITKPKHRRAARRRGGNSG